MKKNLKSIASLLPEGLSEKTITEIATLVETIVTESVKKKVENLNTKVLAFMRTNIDMLKEQAIKELEQENPVFRNAQLFESIRGIMSVELSEEDENHAAINIAKEAQTLEEANEILVEEYNQTLEENQKLSTTIKALAKKVAVLQEELKGTQKALNESKETSPKPFKSSESAVVSSVNGGDPRKGKGVVSKNNNDLLSEEIIDLSIN